MKLIIIMQVTYHISLVAYNKIENLLELKEEMENQRKEDQNKINELDASVIVLRNNLNELDNENKRLQDLIDTI